MEIYLVGGAVRDQLLGLAPGDKDWVVVGASPQQLVDLGYRQVGKDFPVFLHPETNEEYALARTERKVAQGYGGFDVDFGDHITLEDDLLRRDLTINAIAQNNNGELVDPFGGLADIQARELRHVSNAFEEDPLRVLRVARFHARLYQMGFSIHPETFGLMQKLSEAEELNALSRERVWVEIEKGLATTSPDIFIDTLYRCGALEKLIPELHQRFNHRDSLPHTCDVIGERIKRGLQYLASKTPLNSAYCSSEKTTERNQIAWSICCHALESSIKPDKQTTNTIAKADTKNSVVNALCTRLTCPNNFRRLATLSAGYIAHIIQADNLSATVIVELLDHCDAWRREDQFEQLLIVAECLTATHGEEPQPKESAISLLRQAHKKCLQIKNDAFINAGLKGPEIRDAIKQARETTVAELKEQLA